MPDDAAAELHTQTLTGADAELTVRPLRHSGRWAAAALVLVIFAAMAQSLLGNPNVDWPTVREYIFAPVTLRGVLVTLYLTALAMSIGVIGGVVVAVMRLSDNLVLSSLARLFIWFFRGTPVLVQIIFWGYLGALYPMLSLGIPFTDISFWSARTSDVMTALLAATLALGLNEVAYAAEIVRGGITSIDRGQTEAAYSLGLTPATTTRRVVLPQAMRVIVPPMGNELITMLKTTALVSVIAGQDLLTNLQRVYSQNYKVIPLLVVASLWYLAMTSILSIPQAWLERRYGRGDSHRSSGSPWARLIMLRPPRREAGAR